MSAAPRPTLAEVAHDQSNELWDVIAMLEGAHALIGPDSGNSMGRLITEALSRLRDVQTVFNDYI